MEDDFDSTTLDPSLPPALKNRSRAVSVVAGAGGRVKIEGLGDDGESVGGRSGRSSRTPRQQRRPPQPPGEPGDASSTADTLRSNYQRGKRYDPVGLKNRDYAFLSYNFPGHAPELDGLIADYKGVAAKIEEPKADAPTDEVITYMASLDRNALLKKFRDVHRDRMVHQAECVKLEGQNYEAAQQQAEISPEMLQEKAARLREEGLALQLKSLQLDQENLERKRSMQDDTRRLQAAMQAFEEHVGNLEDGWDDYVAIRNEERDDTNDARYHRIKEFEAYKAKFVHRGTELNKDATRYKKLKKNKQKVIKAQEKEIRRLNGLLGIQEDFMDQFDLTGAKKQGKQAKVVTGSEASTSDSDSETSSSDSDSDSDSSSDSSSGSSYSTQYCSTCGETLTVMSGSSVSSSTSGTAHTFDPSDPLGHGHGHRHGHGHGRKASGEGHPRNDPSGGGGASGTKEASSQKKKKKGKKGLLSVIYNAIRHPDILGLSHITKGKKQQSQPSQGQYQQPPSAASSTVGVDPYSAQPQPRAPHEQRTRQDPERGFAFP